MPPKPVDKEKKRREIAAAAMGVFSDHGFEAASIQQVALKAGVGKGTIYEYFRSKEELTAFAIQVWLEEMIQEIERMVEDIEDPGKKLKAYVNVMLEAFLQDESIFPMILSTFQYFTTRLHDTDLGTVLQNMFSFGVDSMTAVVEDGRRRGVFRISGTKEARVIGTNLAAYLDGICIDYLVTGRSFDLRTQVDHYMKYLLRELIK
jgi:AcrR family transcriptional regulator